jgi:hypothetical protein
VSVSVTRSVLRLRAECLACEPMCKGDTSEYWFKSARDCTCGCLCARLCVFSVPLRVLLRMALPASVHVCAHMKVCTGPVFSIRCTSQRLQLPWATGLPCRLPCPGSPHCYSPTPWLMPESRVAGALPSSVVPFSAGKSRSPREEGRQREKDPVLDRNFSLQMTASGRAVFRHCLSVAKLCLSPGISLHYRPAFVT